MTAACIDCGRPTSGHGDTGRCVYCHGHYLGSTRHAIAVERWGADAFAYPAHPTAPNATAACRQCGARCDRRGKTRLCATCLRAARSATCVNGHDLTDPANGRVGRDGKKDCRACDAERKRRHRSDPAVAHAENQARMDRHRRARQRSAA